VVYIVQEEQGGGTACSAFWESTVAAMGLNRLFLSHFSFLFTYEDAKQLQGIAILNV
jgi:hypothetical protein